MPTQDDIVTSLRRHPPQPQPRDDTGIPAKNPIDIERYTNGAYGDLFRAGSDTSDLDAPDELGQRERGHQ